VNAVIALFYYAKVVKSVWLDDPKGDFPGDPTSPPSGSLRLALVVSVALTIAVGLYPALTTFVGEASRVIASVSG
jgi:NADH:ubiquinone oxidoreductase subunit 2 (subunit N)